MKRRFTFIFLASLTLVFTQCHSSKKMAESTNTPLQLVQWNLISIEGEALDSTAYVEKPYIVFNDNGAFTGNFGCNTFFGDYYKKKQKLELTYKGATKKLCQQMSVERTMMKAIKKELNRYEISGNILILYSGKQEIMRFEDSGILLKPTEQNAE